MPLIAEPEPLGGILALSSGSVGEEPRIACIAARADVLAEHYGPARLYLLLYSDLSWYGYSRMLVRAGAEGYRIQQAAARLGLACRAYGATPAVLPHVPSRPDGAVQLATVAVGVTASPAVRR